MERMSTMLDSADQETVNFIHIADGLFIKSLLINKNTNSMRLCEVIPNCIPNNFI